MFVKKTPSRMDVADQRICKISKNIHLHLVSEVDPFHLLLQFLTHGSFLEVLTSFCNFCTDLSANSALASACFSLLVRFLMFSLYDFSRWFAFSSATCPSSSFKLLF